MTNLLNGLQVACLVLLMAQWWLRILKPTLTLPFASWKKIEAAFILAIIIFSAWSALLAGMRPWFELWYAEQIASVMVGAALIRICFEHFRRMLLRIVIGLGICGWLAMAAQAGIHHQPIWF
ncbi:hypothetical protein [Celerinatantimonas yamalensis]|uniref:Uncharacterized protein n=1 Tax=Celerinatantimonas yamalensis TaxID=559956 RepID=A0ABW9G7N5_9GAMM